MAIKGTGFDNSNIKNVTIAAGDILEVDGGMTVGETLDVTGSASIGGDLTVTGDIISRGTVDLIVQDNFIDLNAGNDSQTALASGFTFSLNRASGFTTATVTTFVAGVASTSNPTFTSTDAGSSSLVAAGDVVFITGATEASNDGLYVVSSVDQASFPQVVTIKGVGTVATNGNTPWAQTQFTADTGDTASVYKVDLKVLAIADGANFPDSGGTANTKGTVLEAFAAGATEGDFTSNGDYSALGAASSLQDAYDTGATITTASSTDIAYTLTSGNFLVDSGTVGFGQNTALTSFLVQANDTTEAINLDASASAASVFISNQGATVAEFANSSVVLFDRLNGGAAGSLKRVPTAAADDFTIQLEGATSLDASLQIESNGSGTDALIIQTVTNGGGIDINSVAAVTIDSASASNFTVAGANLTLSTTTSGNIDVTAAGTFSIDGTGASNVTADTGNLTVSTTTSGNLVLTSVDDVDLTAGGELDVGAASADIDITGVLAINSGDTTNLTMDADADAIKTLTIQSNNTNVGASAEAHVVIDADDVVKLTQANNDRLIVNSNGINLGGASVSVNTILDQDDMSADSATALATQQSIKAYVDNSLLAKVDVTVMTKDGGTTINNGDVVAIDSSGEAIQASNAAASTANVVGICVDVTSNTVSVIQTGVSTDVTTVAGSRYFLGTGGAVTTTAPTGSGEVVYQIGFGDVDTNLVIVTQYVMELG